MKLIFYNTSLIDDCTTIDTFTDFVYTFMSSIAIKKYSVLINCDKKYLPCCNYIDLFSHVLCIASKILILSLMPSGLLNSRRYTIRVIHVYICTIYMK